LKLYSASDKSRVYKEPKSELSDEPYRSDFWRDYARLLHCPSFRRLTGKTQLFPNNETDFFRNRLTHSLEVAQIAKSIAKRINHLNSIDVDEDLVSFAALAHDIGHPPFGHQGEEALDECMKYYGGFEGNAQTLRIISKIEKKVYDSDCPCGIDKSGKDKRVGLNLTYRSLAATLKYDNIIPDTKSKRNKYHKDKKENLKPIKGYYRSEEDLIKRIKKNLVGDENYKDFKTIECQIMDVADDIAYSNYDLEDSFKAGFLSPIDLLYPKGELIKRVVDSLNTRTHLTVSPDEVQEILISIYGSILELPEEFKKVPFNKKTKDDLIYYATGNAYKNSRNIAKNGALRTQLTSRLVGKFVRGVEFKKNAKQPILSRVYLGDEILKEVEILKTLTYQSQILSPKLKIAELRGKEIVVKIFEVLNSNPELLPRDFQELYQRSNTERKKKRIVCDFISGMTNKYAIEFYGRLSSENPETIFKPL